MTKFLLAFPFDAHPIQGQGGMFTRKRRVKIQVEGPEAIMGQGGKQISFQ